MKQANFNMTERYQWLPRSITRRKKGTVCHHIDLQSQAQWHPLHRIKKKGKKETERKKKKNEWEGGKKRLEKFSLLRLRRWLLPAPISKYATDVERLMSSGVLKGKQIRYLAWHYLLTLKMIISISSLSEPQVGRVENKAATVSLFISLQEDVDVPAIQVQIMSSPAPRSGLSTPPRWWLTAASGRCFFCSFL